MAARKLNPCAACDLEIGKSYHIVIDGHKFCSSICIAIYSKKVIAELRASVAAWKNSWLEQREIIGRQGLQYVIEPRYEQNKKGNENV